MTKVLFNNEDKTLVVIEIEKGIGTVTEDSFGGYDYDPVFFDYDNSGLTANEDDPWQDWQDGKITLTRDDGVVLTDFEDADWATIEESDWEEGTSFEKANYFHAVYSDMQE